MRASSQVQVLSEDSRLFERQLLKVSIAVFAYNEEGNIGRLLENLSKQAIPDGFELSEIIVVASGCTDRTVEIVRSYLPRVRNLRLITQSDRMGKPAAVNLFLSQAVGNVLVLESADTLPSLLTIQRILEPFRDDLVGGVSSYPVPLEDNSRPLASGIVQLIWTDLNHEFAIRGSVRLSGELFAIRAGIVVRVPENVVHEDAYIERVIALGGHKLVYVPSATVRMRGPRKVSELLTQRRKNIAGHLQLKQSIGFAEPTSNPIQVIRVFIQAAPRMLRRDPFGFLLIPTAALLEGIAHTLAVNDLKRGNLPSGLKHYYLKSTKNL